MRTMGMGTRTVDMTTQIIPMQVTSMKTTTHTIIIHITTIRITIMLQLTMVITTIPTATTAIMTIPLQDTNIYLQALTATTTSKLIFTRQQPQVPRLFPLFQRLLPNPYIRSPKLTAMAPIVMGIIIMAMKTCMEYSCMSWLTPSAQSPWSFPPS